MRRANLRRATKNEGYGWIISKNTDIGVEEMASNNVQPVHPSPFTRIFSTRDFLDILIGPFRGVSVQSDSPICGDAPHCQAEPAEQEPQFAGLGLHTGRPGVPGGGSLDRAEIHHLFPQKQRRTDRMTRGSRVVTAQMAPRNSPPRTVGCRRTLRAFQ